MRTLGWASFAVALVVTFSASAGDDAALKKEKSALQGSWKVISMETNNGKDQNAEGATLEFDKDGKNLVFTGKDNDTKKGTFTLNPTAKPKSIDIKPGDENKTFEGIYQFEKETLKICLAPDSNDGRPAEFALKNGKNYVLIVLEKVK